MKCIYRYGPKDYDRVDDDSAAEAVSSGEAQYVPKHVYKEQRGGQDELGDEFEGMTADLRQISPIRDSETDDG